MIRRWFRNMFLELLFDSEIRKEIIEALEYEKQRTPPPPRPSKYKLGRFEWR